MPENLLIYILKDYGVIGALIVVGCCMVAAAVAQIRFLGRWQPQTAVLIQHTETMIKTLDTIVHGLQRQHATCTRHYEFAQEQIEGMRSLGTELQAIVRSIHESDRERNREILQLMSLLVGRPRATD